ncbi:MAG: DEAD/DEAH box helicase family protein [Alphaproteobacteria bacterium]|nr:DEAD/DEAH box helicase family protein [Alphaproteobacteria bacterium]
MNGKKAEEHRVDPGAVILKLGYPLSEDQKRISDAVVINWKSKKDTLINAVCGAGKTELVYHVIATCLSQGKNVAFAVPRRDVVIELYYRIKEVFPTNTVIALYGGHTERLEADIVVLTTHQLYRYEKYFDLIILDEIDAFPFKGDPLLGKMFFRAVKGNIVMMSATPSKGVIEYFSGENRAILELNTRFHRHPLPVPRVVKKYGYLKFLWLYEKLKQFFLENKVVFVFTPTIDRCEFVYKILSLKLKDGAFVHSKCKDRTKIIQDFKLGKYKYLVTTAVLERGVTFKDLQVVVFDADNTIYDSQALIQIAGRVGRKIDAPEGEVIFLVNKETDEIRKAIGTIKSKNTHL